MNNLSSLFALSDINQRLSKEDELNLVRLMQKQKDNQEVYDLLRDNIVLRSMWIVRNIASIFSKKTIDISFDEMVSAGCVGLLEAIDNFDTTYNVRVTTYSYPRVFLAIWDMIIEYRCGITIPKSLYKKVCSHIKSPKMSDADFAMQNKLSLTELQFIINVTKIGIPVLSSFESQFIDSDEQCGLDFMLTDNNSVNENTSLSSNQLGKETPIHIKLELKMLGDEVEEFSQHNLTKAQHKLLSLTVIPFLRGEEYFTFADAAKHLGKSLQSVDQLMGYMVIRFVQSRKGLRVKKIITETSNFLKQKRSTKGV
jgi:RNA polymerase sigma factor for flagellar operon FliA